MYKHLKRHLLLLTTIVILAIGLFIATYTAPDLTPNMHTCEVALDTENTSIFSPERFVLDITRAIIHALIPVR